MSITTVTFHLLTIFPNIFNSYLQESILGRAQDKNLIKIEIHNLRDFTKDKHKTTDDKPYGGGAGMVMKIEPIVSALDAIAPKKNKKRTRIILLSAGGKVFDQKKARALAKYETIILICGRYEGVDQRVGDYLADEEISLGKFVLTGGELPAMMIVDAVARLLPGVLGNKESLAEESFGPGKRGAEYPHYTRPADFQGLRVPEALLSGDHKKIKEWRTRYTHHTPNLD